MPLVPHTVVLPSNTHVALFESLFRLSLAAVVFAPNLYTNNAVNPMAAMSLSQMIGKFFEQAIALSSAAT